ncbi:MAG TPA: HAD family hydrolase [Planctomycetes bacterium]|nr:HAD family hydrolase [Planctomycetota bacterium]
MGQKKIEAILFDLGETLVNFGKFNRGTVFKEAGRRSYSFLKKLKQPVEGFRKYFWRNMLGLRLRYYISLITGKDFDSLKLLEKYGTLKGFKLSPGQWQELNWLWYEPLRQRSWTEPDLADTLNKLTGAGLALGIISNTFVNSSALDRHLAEEGLIRFFRTRLYSCDFGFRKPDKRIFLEAARQLGTRPDNIMYVGDRINKDIKGALRAGMYAVLKNAYTNAGKKTPAGTERIEQISQLPALVEKINGDLSTLNTSGE